jgi:hypothetical protein
MAKIGIIGGCSPMPSRVKSLPHQWITNVAERVIRRLPNLKLDKLRADLLCGWH